MADKAITDLTQAQQITDDDLFVLEQSGEAKKLKGSQVVQYAKDAVAAEVQGVKEYADTAKTSADAAAASATKAATAAQGIDDKVSAADASAKAAAASAAAAASSATGVDEKVQAAQTAADNAAKSETAAKNAQTAASNAQSAAESAQTGAQSAKTAAESAQEAAESAKDAAAGSSTAAGQKATQAAQSAENAASAKSAAETAKTDAQAARDAIVNMIVEAVTLETGKPATVEKSLVDNVYKLVFGLPRGKTGATGSQGATGNGISDISLKSGTHAPGTSDVYTITLTDGTTFDFEVYNGANGQGAGDMLASVYDPQGKRTDVYKYVDDAIRAIPAPNVSAQIKAHNESTTAHPDIRNKIPTKTSQLDNDSGYLTQHQDISGKLDKPANNATATAGQLLTKTANGQEWRDPEKEIFIVTFSYSGTYHANKTFAEIKAAYDAGKMCYASVGGNICLRGVISNSYVTFTTFNAQGSSEVISTYMGFIRMYSDNSIVVNNMKLQPIITVSGLLKGDGSGGLAAAVAETDFASPVFMRKVTLPVASWNSNTKQQSVTVTGVLADTTKQCIYPAPVDTSYDSAWNSCGVLCVAQAANSLTFQCSEVPTSAIEVYVTVITLSYKG